LGVNLEMKNGLSAGRKIPLRGVEPCSSVGCRIAPNLLFRDDNHMQREKSVGNLRVKCVALE
jgi:hypothetical protein